jgi:hypothetical protein
VFFNITTTLILIEKLKWIKNSPSFVWLLTGILKIPWRGVSPESMQCTLSLYYQIYLLYGLPIDFRSIAKWNIFSSYLHSYLTDFFMTTCPKHGTSLKLGTNRSHRTGTLDVESSKFKNDTHKKTTYKRNVCLYRSIEKNRNSLETFRHQRRNEKFSQTFRGKFLREQKKIEERTTTSPQSEKRDTEKLKMYKMLISWCLYLYLCIL